MKVRNIGYTDIFCNLLVFVCLNVNVFCCQHNRLFLPLLVTKSPELVGRRSSAARSLEIRFLRSSGTKRGVRLAQVPSNASVVDVDMSGKIFLTLSSCGMHFCVALKWED